MVSIHSYHTQNTKHMTLLFLLNPYFPCFSLQFLSKGAFSAIFQTPKHKENIQIQGCLRLQTSDCLETAPYWPGSGLSLRESRNESQWRKALNPALKAVVDPTPGVRQMSLL